MTTTDLKLEKPGTLLRPGPVGRLARLGFGGLCLYYVYGLVTVSGSILTSTGSIRPLLWNGILPGLFLVSYVVNIGLSRTWNKWPAGVSALALGTIALVGYLTSSSVETPMLARSIWVWELYVFGHLGTAFLIAAFIGTPGCEMRAFHDLYSRVTGVATKEHYCPIGPLHAIDQWEAARREAR